MEDMAFGGIEVQRRRLVFVAERTGAVRVGREERTCPGADAFPRTGIHYELDLRGAPSDFLRMSHRSTCKRSVTSDYRSLLVTMVWRSDENWPATDAGGS